jgi:hypothetical protein
MRMRTATSMVSAHRLDPDAFDDEERSWWLHPATEASACIGWWPTGIVVGVACFLAVIVIGLPFAFYLCNCIPTVLTLRGRTRTYEVRTSAEGRTPTSPR